MIRESLRDGAEERAEDPRVRLVELLPERILILVGPDPRQVQDKAVVEQVAADRYLFYAVQDDDRRADGARK